MKIARIVDWAHHVIQVKYIRASLERACLFLQQYYKQASNSVVNHVNYSAANLNSFQPSYKKATDFAISHDFVSSVLHNQLFNKIK